MVQKKLDEGNHKSDEICDYGQRYGSLCFRETWGMGEWANKENKVSIQSGVKM